jgi:hypothetical protein
MSTGRLRRARIAGRREPASVSGDELVSINGGRPLRDVIEFRVLSDEAEVELELRRGGLELNARDRQGEGEPLGAEVSERRVRPGPHVRQPLRVLLHLPAAPGHASQPVPEGRRLPPVVPVRELHHAHPLHRGRPRAGPGRGPVAAVRQHPRDRPRGAQRDAAQPARRDEPAVAAGAARPRHRGARPDRAVCPGSTTATCSTDTLADVLDEYPRARVVAVVPLGVSRFNKEPRMRLHTVDEAERRLRCRGPTGRSVPARARPAHGVRRRRVLPAGRAAVPRRRGLRRLLHARGRHRHGPHLRASSTDVPTTVTGPRSGFFAAVDAPPPNPAAYTGLRGAPRRHGRGDRRAPSPSPTHRSPC